MLRTPLEQLAYIIERAREFDAETEPVDDVELDPSDERDVAILEATPNNPIRAELAAALDALNDDQRIEVLALLWLGRGDFDAAEWRDAVAQAREVHNAAETEYLLGTPLLADYLEEGIAALGYSLAS